MNLQPFIAAAEASTNAIATSGPVSTDPNQWKQSLFNYLKQYGLTAVGGVIILAIGYLVAKWLGKLLNRWLEQHQMEPPLRSLLVRIVRILIMGLTIIMVLEQLGVHTTTLIAGVGVAGVGVGLATQGVLSNLFAGLTIIFTKPFRVGEYVEIASEHGQVKAIDLFTTTLSHPDLSRVVIPNRKIVGEILHNYGQIRQVNVTVCVAYGTNLSEAISLLKKIVAANPRVLKNPAPGVSVGSIAEYGINLSASMWASLPDYGGVSGELYEAILGHFRAQKIEIPLPQREIRMLETEKKKEREERHW